MNLSYDEIRRIHRLEKDSSKLVEVEQQFYNDLHVFLTAEKEQYLNSLKDLSSTKSRDFANLKKMVEEIFAMRGKKILGRALIGSRTGDSDESHMAMQEKKLYVELVSLLKMHNHILDEIFESQESEKDLNTLSVQILSDIPGFVGADMNEYGPFEKGVVAVLPLKIAKLLLSRKLVEVKS
ncbi:MAG TPA: hypothetical protein VJG83_00185 [archaeon]|nr:hypothetical protein [archaeon]